MNLKTFYDQKTILITGAASGIGRRFAERVAEEADVSLVLWDRNPDVLAELKKELAEKADVCIGGVDISDKLQVYYEAEHVMKEGLLPDVIINCAGVVSGKFFHEMLPEEIDSTIRST
jgi:all-trans-retinol dehydrogenase (NAD+)